MAINLQSQEHLLLEIDGLRARLDEAEETLRAIAAGEVDALVVAGPAGNRIFTLEGAETPYRVLVEQMHEGAVTLSGENVVLYANPRFAALVRTPLDRVMGAGFDSFLAPAGRPAFADLLQASHVAPIAGEVLGLASDGAQVPLQLALSRLPAGSTGAVCIVATDVLEQAERANALQRNREQLELRVAEKTFTLETTTNALCRSEERIRATLYAIAEAVIVTDATGAILHMNRVAENLTGWKEAEVLGRPASEVYRTVNEETGAAMEDPVARVLHGGKVAAIAIDILLVARDGLERPVAESSSPILVGNGNLAGCVLVFRDQTAGRAKQIRLQSLLDESTESRGALVANLEARQISEAERDRLMTAIEQASEVVLVTDVDGTLQYVNPAFEAVTGYTREEAIGQNPRMLRSGVHSSAFYRELWDTLKGGQPWRGRLVNKRKDGTLYTEEASISPVCDPQGRVVNFVAVKRDITQQMRLEEQLRASQKMEAIGHLAGGVAHDFNNLLSVILSYSSLALEGLRADDPLSADLAEIENAAKRAAGLTRQLLAFSRKQVLQPQVLDLNAVVAQLEKMLGRLIGEEIELKQELAPDLGRVLADPGQIEQVLMNLVVNARDAMPGGGKVTIETANVDLDEEYVNQRAGATPGPYVRLAVTDSGCGMDEATQKRLFEPFFTTKEKGKGTGLGLSTAYGIVRQSGGHITVYSEPGRGTTFKVYLPRHIEDLASPVATVHPESPMRGTETILLAEDEAAVRKVAARILRAAGYRVLDTSNGGEALLTCERYPSEIHLLLTDVVMPQVSGPQLADRLQKVRPGLPVLYMSGYTDDALLHHGVLEPGTRLIGKPFVAADLLRKVREALDAAARPGEGAAGAGGTASKPA